MQVQYSMAEQHVPNSAYTYTFLQVQSSGTVSAIGRLLGGLLGRTKGTQDHASKPVEGNEGLDAGGILTVCLKTGRTSIPPCICP